MCSEVCVKICVCTDRCRARCVKVYADLLETVHGGESR